MTERGPLEHIGNVYELNQIALELQDPELTDALDTIVKLIAKPDVPPKAVAPLLVKLEAQAASFRMKAKYYMIYQKEGDAAKRKNTYLTLADSIDRLCDSLKYLARNY